MKLTELKINPKNPRIIRDKKFEQLKRSIYEFPNMMGLRPIIYDDKTFTILGGEKRYLALIELGYKEIPADWVKPASDLTEEEKKRFIIQDNTHYGEWDFEALSKEWGMMPLLEWGLELSPLDETGEVQEDNYEIPPKIETDIKPGDMFQIGKHRLLCGDAKNKADIERVMNGKKADVVFTSPPYNMNGGMYANYSDNLKSAEYISLNIQAAQNIIPFIKGYLFWNISYNKNARWEFIEIMYKLIKESGLRFLEMIVWDKMHAIPITSKDMLTRTYEDILLLSTQETMYQDIELYYCGSTEKRANFIKPKGSGITNYWQIDTNKSQTDSHLACFPVKLPAKALSLVSHPGGICVDIFSGIGTTMVAADQLKQICYALELTPEYCQATIDRMKKLNPGITIEKI